MPATKTHRRTPSASSPQRIDIVRNYRKAPGFQSIYANDVQVQTSPWDMRLLLGSVEDPATRDNPVMGIAQLADLRISLPLAKRLVEIMIEQITEYEARFGAIPTSGVSDLEA